MTKLIAQVLGLLLLTCAIMVASVRFFETVTAPYPTAGTGVKSDRQADSETATQSSQFQRPPLTAFPQTMAQPIFFEGRRFPEPKLEAPVPVAAEPPPPPVAAPAPPPPDQLKLVGIRIDAEGKKALISNLDRTASWYSEGDQVGAWLLETIEADRVTVSTGGSKVPLEMYPSPRKDQLTP